MTNTQITEILQAFWKQALAVIDAKYMSVSKSKSIIKTEANKIVPEVVDNKAHEVVDAELDNYALKSTLSAEIQKITESLATKLANYDKTIKDLRDITNSIDLGLRYTITDTIDGIEIKPGIYLVPKETADGEKNIFTEYLAYTKDDGSMAVEKIGDTTVSFEGYATEDYVNNKVTNVTCAQQISCNYVCFGTNCLWIN